MLGLAALCLKAASMVVYLTVVPASVQSQALNSQLSTRAVPEVVRLSTSQSNHPDDQAASRLLAAVSEILQEAADERNGARNLPTEDEFLVKPFWTETREQRQLKIRKLLDAALDVVTEIPLVEEQEKLEAFRRNIQELEGRIAVLQEERLSAPQKALLPGILTNTVESIDNKIVDLKKRIELNRTGISVAKQAISASLVRSDVEITPQQLDLLLDSVLSGDLIRLVATFEAAKHIDRQLGRLVAASEGNLTAARRYFAMHAALFALLVHAQDSSIEKIDNRYLPRLETIRKAIASTAQDTRRLLGQRNRPDQQRALKANLKSQALATRVAKYYSGFLIQQRSHLVKTRSSVIRDLEIADNTYQTVEVSFQLRALIKDASASFDAIRKLETPGFEQIFKNQELRREFENLTRKLSPPTS